MIIYHQKNIGPVLGLFLKLRLLICLERVSKCASKLLLCQCYQYIFSLCLIRVCCLTCVGSVALGLCSCAGAVVGHVQLLEGHAAEVLRRGGAAPALSHAGEALWVGRAALHGGCPEEPRLRSGQLIVLLLFLQLSLSPHAPACNFVQRKAGTAARGCGSGARVLLP